MTTPYFDRLRESLAPDPVRPPAEQYIARLPGVGGGLLDTLRALYRRPLQFDTASANPGQLAVFQPSWQRLGQDARVVMNPRAFAGETNPEMAPMTLGHEVIAHGMAGVGRGPGHQESADDFGRALLELSGRRPPALRETEARGFVRERLQQLEGTPWLDAMRQTFAPQSTQVQTPAPMPGGVEQFLQGLR